jgi:uncharacterized protein (TIRG00374 family)
MFMHKGRERMKMAIKEARSQHHWQNGLPIPRDKLAKGMRYFALLTIIGLLVLFYTTSTEETFSALKHLNFHFLFLAAVLQTVDIALGGWRNHILIKRFKPGVTPWLCFRAQLANEFGAAVTPGQSGGLPAWLFTLHRGGIAIAPAMAVSVIVFMSTLLVFQLTTFGSTIVLGTASFDATFSYLFKYGVATCTVLLIIILLSLWMPAPLRNALTFLSRRLRKSSGAWPNRMAMLIEQALAKIQEYQNSCKQFLQKDKMAVLQAFFVTLLYYLGKLNLAYLILLGMGVEVNYLTAMAVLALLRFILYFAPTPGGSGVGELSIAALMSALMPAYLLPIYAILYRTFHLYMPAALGAWVLFGELRKSSPQISRSGVRSGVMP